MVQKWPIWGHHTQKHRFYGIKRWNTMRKKNLFLAPPIPPWSRWPSDSGKLRGAKNKSIYFFHFWSTFWIKKSELLWPCDATLQDEVNTYNDYWKMRKKIAPVAWTCGATSLSYTTQVNVQRSTTKRTLACWIPDKIPAKNKKSWLSSRAKGNFQMVRRCKSSVIPVYLYSF